MDSGGKTYESVIILSPILHDSENKDIFNKIESFIKENGGNIVEGKIIGLKKMAYSIKKFENGYYIYFEFNIDPSKIKDLEIFYRRDERIIRFIVCNLDKAGIKYNKERREKNGKILTIVYEKSRQLV